MTFWTATEMLKNELLLAICSRLRSQAFSCNLLELIQSATVEIHYQTYDAPDSWRQADRIHISVCHQRTNAVRSYHWSYH